MAQQPEQHTIGILDSASPELRGNEMVAFYRGLNTHLGDADVFAIHAWAKNDHTKLEELAEGLCKRKVEVIVACGGTISLKKSKKMADQVTPLDQKPKIVFTAVTGPEEIIGNPAAPGRNETGVAHITGALDPNRFAELKRITGATVIGVLIYKHRLTKMTEITALKNKALCLEVDIEIKEAGDRDEIKAQLEAFHNSNIRPVLVASDPFFYSQRYYLSPIAKDLKLRTMFQWRAFVEARGLASYGPSIEKAYEKAGEYTAKILGGHPPGSLPIVATDTLEKVMSVSTASHVGVEVPNDYLNLP